MRALVLSSVALGVLAVATPVAADPPPLDVPATARAMGTEQVQRAPGATAQLDEARVRAALAPDTRLVLAPPRPLAADGDDYAQVYGPLSAAAREADLELVLVRGLTVQVVGSGTMVPTDLPSTRTQLAHADVTDLVLSATQALADPEGFPGDDGTRPPLTGVPADPALVDEVAAGLARTPLWVAPGVAADPAAAADWPERVPGLGLRVAVLPLLPVGAPDPDLLTPLAQRFPGELVVVVRGTWLEAVGPQQSRVDSARDYVLGRYQSLLSGREVPPTHVVRVFLDRLGQLRSDVAFSRPQVRRVDAGELFSRWAPRVALGLALAVGGGALLRTRTARRRRQQEQAAAYRLAVAGVLQDVTRLGARLLDAPRRSGPAAEAAERYATAQHLLEQAEQARDPEVLAAAAEAAAHGRRLLEQVRA